MATSQEVNRKLLAAAERLGRALRLARQQIATRHSVSLLQLQLIEQLRERRPRRIGALAAELAITQPTVSDAIATLEHKGLVARVRDPADARATIVELTELGDRLVDRIDEELGPLFSVSASETADDEAVALRVLLAEIARFQSAGLITIDRSCLTCHHFAPATEERMIPHCLLLDQPLADHDLRVDCTEHEPQTRELGGRRLPQFVTVEARRPD